MRCLTEVAKRQAVEVQVTGHTDRVGSEADNDRLSLQRAEAVRAMLIQRGINANFHPRRRPRRARAADSDCRTNKPNRATGGSKSSYGDAAK